MSHKNKAEESQDKAERRARKKQSKKEDVKVKAAPDSDELPPAVGDSENRLKTEKKERKKEKKRKREDDVENSGTKASKKSKASNEANNAPVASAPHDEHETSVAASKKLKKRKAADKEAEDFISLEEVPMETNGDAKSEKHKKKKVKKDKKAGDDSAQGVNGNEAALLDEKIDEAAQNPQSGKKSRFVVFVGNLPFNASKEDIQKHFEKINPTDVRIMTDKQTKKPKGFAFVEFDRFDRMETCLKKYQHSLFGEGKKARKINVELTAGGGGNNESRKAKIQAKNDKLHDERQREREKRDELEAKQQERKIKKESKQKDTKATANGTGVSDAPADENGGMHPARLAMMNKPATPGKPYGRTRY